MILNNDVLIREITAGDKLDLLAIRNDPENYKWFFHETSISEEEHTRWFKDRLLTAKFFTLVADLNNRVIGIAYLNEFNSTIAKISINIKSDMKGIGAGTKLLQELITRSKTTNINSLHADIKISNEASIYFFTQHGFVDASHNSKNLHDIHTEGATLILSLSL